MARPLGTLVIALSLALAGCSSPKSAIAVYDNRGGFAYPGQRITFYSSGQYESESYTDVRSERRSTETGTFTKTDSTYVLVGTNGQTIYYIVRVRGVEYLLDGQSHQEYARTKDAEKLYGKMRRAG